MKKVLQAIKLAVAKQNHLSEFNKDLDLFYYGRLLSFFRGLLGLTIIVFFFTAGAKLMFEFFVEKFSNAHLSSDIPQVNEELNTVTLTFDLDRISSLNQIMNSSDVLISTLQISIFAIVLILILSAITFVLRVKLHQKEVDSMVCELTHPKLINSWEVETIIVDGVKYEVKGIDDEGVLICETLEEGIYE